MRPLETLCFLLFLLYNKRKECKLLYVPDTKEGIAFLQTTTTKEVAHVWENT